MRILIRTSRWAIWARRFATFAAALMIVSIVMHLFNALESDTFVIALGLATVLAVVALFCAISAFIRLWHTGDHGWGKSVFALFVGSACLIPSAYAVATGISAPLTNYVTTDWDNPPALLSSAKDATQQRATPEQILAAFPNAVSRTYSVELSLLFEEAKRLALQSGWTVNVERQSSAFGRPAQINATARTLLGFEDEVSITIQRVQNASKIDMTSASKAGVGDLGVNGRRIEAFLLALDEVMADLTVRTLTVDEPEDEPDAVVEGATDT